MQNVPSQPLGPGHKSPVAPAEASLRPTATLHEASFPPTAALLEASLRPTGSSFGCASQSLHDAGNPPRSGTTREQILANERRICGRHRMLE